MPDSARFTIAIVCALPLEYDALVAVLDSSPRILPHATDQFLYTTGRFATHEVVIAYPEEYGPRDAALAIQFLEHKYGSMEFIILLGICAGIPVPPERGNPIYLGDVVISTAVLAYAHGARKNPAGLEFREIFPKKARGKIRQIHRLLSTEYFLGDLVKRSREGLAQVGNMKARYMLLPANEDLFFDSAYHHLHRSNCPENKCDAFAPHICQIAEKQSCAELQCDLQHLYRCRPSFEITPVEIHTGVFASADTVMRDPQVRDDLAREHKVLAFDMEATGIWDLNPHVVVIKGVCDYGDSHKSKQWQDLAAAHAACVAKALVTTFFPKDEGKWEGIDTQHQHTFKRRETNVSDEIGQTTSQSLYQDKTLPLANFASARRPSPDGMILSLSRQMYESVQSSNYDIARAISNVLDEIIKTHAANLKPNISIKECTLSHSTEDTWNLQVDQILTFFSTIDLNPAARLASAIRLRDAKRHKSLQELPPFWLSPKYQHWKNSKGASLLMLEGTFRLKSPVKSICVEMIELVRKVQIPVLFALKTREDPRMAEHLPVGILRSLVSQALRVNPNLNVQNFAGLTYGHFQDAESEDDWLKLLGRATTGLPELMILVDMELFGPVSLKNSTATGVPYMFLRLINELVKLNPDTSMKIILVSYGCRAFAAIKEPEMREKIIQLGKATRRAAVPEGRIARFAQRRSLGSRLSWREAGSLMR